MPGLVVASALQPFLRLRMNTTQSINSGSLTALSWDTVSDSYAWGTLPAVPTSVITLNYTGIILVTLHDLDWADQAIAISTGIRRFNLEYNGNAATRRVPAQMVGAGGAANNQSVQSGATFDYVTAGDTLKIYVNHTAGSALSAAVNDLFIHYLMRATRTWS